MTQKQMIFIIIAIAVIFIAGYFTHYLIYSSHQIDSSALIEQNDHYRKEIERLKKDSLSDAMEIEALNIALIAANKDTIPIHNEHENNAAAIHGLPADGAIDLLSKNLSAKDRSGL